MAKIEQKQKQYKRMLSDNILAISMAKLKEKKSALKWNRIFIIVAYSFDLDTVNFVCSPVTET